MKLFHKENGKETVYVQMQDILYLVHESNVSVPASIFEKVFSAGAVFVTDANRFDFIRFEEEHEVDFFKNLEFVIDYDQYKGFSDEQLKEEVLKFEGKANEIAKNWNGMTEEERSRNLVLYEEHKNLDYMCKFLCEVYFLKHGKRTMPFPDFVK